MSDSRLSWRATFLLLVAMLLAAGAWVFWRVEAWPARAAREVSEAFAEVAHLRPKITIHDRVFFEQTTSVLELAVVSRETQVERETEREWLGSKKRIKLRGVFLVKAGFDLTEPFSVRVEGTRVTADLPPPKILSVEQTSLEILALENGIWNKISSVELEGEIRALPLLARQKARAAGVEYEAVATLSARLREKLAPAFEVETRIPPRRD